MKCQRHQWFVVLPFDDGLERPRCQQGPDCQLEVMDGLGISAVMPNGKVAWHVVLFCAKHAQELREQERHA